MRSRAATALAFGLIVWAATGGVGNARKEAPPTHPTCASPLVAGDQHHNFLVGTNGSDRIEGYQGNDEMHGSPTFGAGDDGGDCMLGHQGQDEMRGYQGNDYMDGAQGEDLLDGDGGNDRMFGDEGPDSLFGGAGMDYLDGGNGPDRLNGGPGEDEMYGQRGPDTLTSAESLNGNTPAADYVHCGTEGNSGDTGGPDTAIVDALDTVVDCENVTVV